MILYIMYILSLWSLASPELWLIRVVALVVRSDTLPHTDDTLQAVPHAGNIELPFLATRAESICLCAGIALAVWVLHEC